MSWRPRVLLVAPSPVLARDLFAWLTDSAYDVSLVTTFAAAKVHMELGPQVLISEIRLAEYNGLHLASRAQARCIPSIVVGDTDPVLERDAQQMGVTFMGGPLDREYLLRVVDHLTADAMHLRGQMAGAGASASNLAFVTSAELAPVKVPRSSRRLN